MNRNVIYITALTLVISIGLIISCQKDSEIVEDQTSTELKTAPDTNWTDIGSVSVNDEVAFDISTSAIKDALEDEREAHFDDSTSTPYLYVAIDTIYFMKYYVNASDTTNNNYKLYLVVEGDELSTMDANYIKFTRIAYTGVQIYNDEIYLLTDVGGGIGRTHTCTGNPCGFCEFTYRWQWWIFHGRVTGCNCTDTEPDHICNHSTSISGTISISL